MDDLAFVRERIESYADYTNDDSRRLVDEQIRAYVGEAVSRLQERLGPDGAAGDALSAILLRCQFADQHVVRALEAATVDGTDFSAVHKLDRDLTAAAERADSIAPPSLDDYLTEISTLLDARTRVLLARAESAVESG